MRHELHRLTDFESTGMPDTGGDAINAMPTLPQVFRDHAALLNGYAPEDEGLYDDVLRE